MEIPAPVAAKARAAGAQRWLDDLPALVDAVQREWSCVLGRVYPDASEALVADATLADGTAAVLKLIVPRDFDPARHEITVLRLAGGEGCATLLRADEERGALLLERLGPSLHDLGLPIGQRHEILVDAVRRVWRPAAGYGLPTGAEKGRWLERFVTTTWEQLDRPCTERAVAYALACVARRIQAHDDERAVLVHGDAHEWNTLRSADGYKLVDPDGLLAEAEYDLGVLMREDPVELTAGDPWERARWLAARTGVNATAIWEWGVVERVSTGLTCTSIGLQPVGRQMLAAADAVTERYG